MTTAEFDIILKNLQGADMEGFRNKIYVLLGCYKTLVTDSSVKISKEPMHTAELQALLGPKYKDYDLACKSVKHMNMLPIGKSGFTVATGFDISQTNMSGIMAAFGGRPLSLLDAVEKRKSYLLYKNNLASNSPETLKSIPDHITFVDLQDAEVVNKFDLISRLSMYSKDYVGPRPDYHTINFTPGELQFVDKTILLREIGHTIDSYNQKGPVLEFEKLPVIYKTVLVSVVYNARKNKDSDVLLLAAKGKWKEAAGLLLKKGGNRRAREAKYILDQLSLPQRMADNWGRA